MILAITITYISKYQMLENRMGMQKVEQSRHKKLEQIHPGYAYQLLQLQMAVQDQKLSISPSITQITKLLELYMIGVEVLQSRADPRFAYFNNKIHSLMMKKHILKKLHEEYTGKDSNSDISLCAVNKAELQQKKNEYQINNYFNQEQVDIAKVKKMLSNAEKRENAFKGKVKQDIKKQQNRLQQRIRQRKMRSENGSVKKFGNAVDNQRNQRGKFRDSRLEYFNDFDSRQAISNNRNQNMLTLSNRKSANSMSKIIDKKYGNANKYTAITPAIKKNAEDCGDAI